MRGCKRAISNCQFRETIPLWSGDNPFVPVWTTRISYHTREEATCIQITCSKPPMAGSSHTQSLAEQSERLLQQTSRIFPDVPYFTSGPTPVFNHFPRGQSTDMPKTPRKLDIKQEADKEPGTRSQQPGRRKQTNPKRTTGYESRSTSPQDGLGESRLRVRKVVSRGIQCMLLTSMEPPGASRGAVRGGVTVRMIPSWDPRNSPREFLQKKNKRARTSVIKKNIWSKL